MAENKGLRLVAMIEKEGDYFTPEFRIINFLSDIKVEKVMNGESHMKKDSNYLFQIKELDIVQIPYDNNIGDLSIIVGENGTGKTTILNQILAYQNTGSNKEVIYVFQNENDKSLSIYPNYKPEMMIINDISGRPIGNKSDKPYIMKFSNSSELYEIEEYSFRPRVKDISKFSSLLQEREKIANTEIMELQDMVNSIQFVGEYKSILCSFVDYTNVGISFSFNLPYRLPERSQQIKVEVESYSNKTNYYQTYLMLDFFSVLINIILESSYANGVFGLLEKHLEYISNEENLELQYKSIANRSDQFLPYDYGIRGIVRDINKDEYDDSNSFTWIEIWHSLYIINLFIEMKKEFGEKANKYLEQIELLKSKLEDKLRVFSVSPIGSEVDLEGNRLLDYLDIIGLCIEDTTPENVEQWEEIWRINESLAKQVAKAVSYTSYFELTEQGSFVSHKLNPDRVWGDLEKEIDASELIRLKEFKEIIEKVKNRSLEFSTVLEIISKASSLETSEVISSLNIEWDGMSSGELMILKLFSYLYYARDIPELSDKNSEWNDHDNILLLIDEVDLGLHPEWQRKWVSVALPIIGEIFKEKHVQIIMTTHSPIMLSDIYPENVIMLQKDESGNRVVVKNGDLKTFGQNIHDLYRDSFFLESTRGEYAKTQINETISILHQLQDWQKQDERKREIYNEKCFEQMKELSSDLLSEEHFHVWLEKYETVLASIKANDNFSTKEGYEDFYNRFYGKNSRVSKDSNKKKKGDYTDLFEERFEIDQKLIGVVKNGDDVFQSHDELSQSIDEEYNSQYKKQYSGLREEMLQSIAPSSSINQLDDNQKFQKVMKYRIEVIGESIIRKKLLSIYDGIYFSEIPRKDTRNNLMDELERLAKESYKNSDVLDKIRELKQLIEGEE